MSTVPPAFLADDPSLLPPLKPGRATYPWVKRAVVMNQPQCLRTLLRPSGALGDAARHAALLEAIKQHNLPLMDVILDGWTPTNRGEADSPLLCAVRQEDPVYLKRLLAVPGAKWALGIKRAWLQALRYHEADHLALLAAHPIERDLLETLAEVPPQLFPRAWAVVPDVLKPKLAVARMDCNVRFPQRLSSEWPLVGPYMPGHEVAWIAKTLDENAPKALRFGLQTFDTATMVAGVTRIKGAVLDESQGVVWECLPLLHQWLKRNGLDWTSAEKDLAWSELEHELPLDQVTYTWHTLTRAYRTCPDEAELAQRDAWLLYDNRSHARATIRRMDPSSTRCRDDAKHLETFIRCFPERFERAVQQAPEDTWLRTTMVVCPQALPYFKDQVRDWDWPLRAAMLNEPSLYGTATGTLLASEQRRHQQWWEQVLALAPDPMTLDRPSRGVLANLLALQTPVATVAKYQALGMSPHAINSIDGRCPVVWLAIRGDLNHPANSSSEIRDWTLDERHQALMGLYRANATAQEEQSVSLLLGPSIEGPQTQGTALAWFGIAQSLEVSRPESAALLRAITLQHDLEQQMAGGDDIPSRRRHRM